MSTAANSEQTSAMDGVAGLVPRRGTGPVSGGVTEPSAEPSETASGTGATPRVTSASAGLVFDDPLDRPSSEDTDRGWGDAPSGSADDDFTRFLSEKPPHHL